MGNSFGFLVRSIYHEYIHAWDFANIKRNHDYDGYGQIRMYTSSVEFRAHYLMALNNNGRLPNMRANEKRIYWGAVLDYTDSKGAHQNFYNNIMIDPGIRKELKDIYTGWYNQIKSYTGK